MNIGDIFSLPEPQRTEALIDLPETQELYVKVDIKDGRKSIQFTHRNSNGKQETVELKPGVNRLFKRTAVMLMIRYSGHKSYGASAARSIFVSESTKEEFEAQEAKTKPKAK